MNLRVTAIGAFITMAVAAAAQTSTETVPLLTGAAPSGFTASNIYQLNGNVGIGTSLTVNAASGSGILINNAADNSAMQSLNIESVAGRSIWFVASSCSGCWNSLTQQDDQAIYFSGAGSGTGNLVIAPWNGPGGIRITSGGNVGIGTTAPGATLEVNGNVKLTSGSGASMTFADGTAQTTAWTGVLCGGDYAEEMRASGDKEKYGPGDVLVLAIGDADDVRKSAEPYSTMVAGIFATKPGVIGRREEVAKSTANIPMAMVGVVPTKVSAENGPIRKGDLLVTSSTPGYAMKGTDRGKMLGAVIGKAMGSLDSGAGTIEVLVTLQ